MVKNRVFLSLSLLIGVLFFVNFGNAQLKSTCLIVSNVNCSTDAMACVWNNAELWTNCSINGSPQTSDSANLLMAKLPYKITLNSAVTLTDLTIGSAANKLPAQQVLSVSGVGLTATSITTLFGGVLDLDLGDENTLTTGAFNIKGSSSGGSKVIWRSGTISQVGSSTNLFTVQSTSSVEVSGTVTLNRDLQNIGNQTFNTGSSVTISPGKYLSTNGTTFFNGAVTINDPSNTANFRIIGPSKFDLGINSVELNVITTVNSPLVFDNTGAFLRFNSNTTLADVAVANGGTLELNGGSNTVNSIRVGAFSTFRWTNGDIRINAGVFVNNGTSEIQNKDGENSRIYSTSTGSVLNYGTLNIKTPLTVQTAPFINNGNLFLPATSSLSIFRMSGVDVSYLQPYAGESQLNIVREFTWTGGKISGALTVNSGTNVKIVGPVVLETSTLNINTQSTTATIQGTVSAALATINLKQGGTLEFQAAILTAGSSLEESGTFNNNGVIQGKATFTQMLLNNTGSIGASYTSSNPTSQFTITGSQSLLNLEDSSKIFIDIYSTTDVTTITVSGGAAINLGGSLIVRPRKAFIASTSTVIPFMMWNDKDLVSGNFSEVKVDSTYWDNTYGCTSVNIIKDNSKKQYKLTFSGCSATGTPSSGTGSGSSTINKSATILIVLVVVFIVVVLVILLAWCKKKYKKKPWDRLKDDRF